MFASPQLYIPRRKPIIVSGGATPAWIKTDNPAIQNLGVVGVTLCTFLNVAIGTASADRIVVVNLTTSDGAVSGVTIGGNAMTKALQSNTGQHVASQWYLLVTSGTTATVIVTADNLGYVGITAGALTGTTGTPVSTGLLAYNYVSDPQVASSVTIGATGVALVCGASETPATPTWNNGTQDYSTISGTAWQIISGYSTTPGAFAASISNYNFAGMALAVSNWS